MPSTCSARRVPATRPPGLEALGLGVGTTPAGGVRDRDTLTRREREVLELLAAGRSNDEIAAALVLSVESHVAHIYEKVGLSGRSARAGATAYALANGLA
jgi:ATP/maltotriose-dependent transcriptional regulator MalT